MSAMTSRPPPAAVVAHAAGLLGLPAPPLVPFEEAGLSAMARSFYDDNKRVSNALIKSELGVALRYPNYRDGLAAILRERGERLALHRRPSGKVAGRRIDPAARFGRNAMPAYNVLILGASYGSLLATKLLFGGHKTTMVCLPAEVEAFNSEGAHRAAAGARPQGAGRAQLAEIARQPQARPAPATSTRPISTWSRWRCRSRNTARPGCANCSTRWRRARCRRMSIMNMPPLPYLKRIPGLDTER